MHWRIVNSAANESPVRANGDTPEKKLQILGRAGSWRSARTELTVAGRQQIATILKLVSESFSGTSTAASPLASSGTVVPSSVKRNEQLARDTLRCRRHRRAEFALSP